MDNFYIFLLIISPWRLWGQWYEVLRNIDQWPCDHLISYSTHHCSMVSMRKYFIPRQYGGGESRMESEESVFIGRRICDCIADKILAILYLSKTILFPLLIWKMNHWHLVLTSSSLLHDTKIRESKYLGPWDKISHLFGIWVIWVIWVPSLWWGSLIVDTRH